MPPGYRQESFVPRGVSNRRAAMKWLRQQDPPPAGVLYFLDDDNAIDIRWVRTAQLRGQPVALQAFP